MKKSFTASIIGGSVMLLALAAIPFAKAESVQADANLVSSVTPADGTAWEGLVPGASISFTINNDQVGYLYMNMTNVTDDDWLGSTDNFKQEGNVWTFTKQDYDPELSYDRNYVYAFPEGKTIEVTVNAYADVTQANFIGSQTFTYTGTFVDTNTSDITFLGANPADGTSVPNVLESSDLTITLNFSGPVKVVAAQGALNYGSYTNIPCHAAAEYSDTWTITVDQSLLDMFYEYEGLRFVIYAKDEDGKSIYYDGQEFISLNYPIERKQGDSGEQVSASLVTLEGLSTVYSFTVTWGYEELAEGTMKATVTRPDGTVDNYTGRLVDEDPNGGSGIFRAVSDENNAFLIAIPNGYSAEGDYLITVEAGAVIIDGVQNAEATLIYTIGESTEMSLGEVIYPEGTYTSFLGSVTISYGQDITQVASEAEFVASVKVGQDAPVSAPLRLYEEYEDDGQGGGVAPLADDENDGPVAHTVGINVDLADVISWGTFGDVVITIPEGIVANEYGAKNQAQDFTFHLMPANSDLKYSPVSSEGEGYVKYEAAQLSKVTLQWMVYPEGDLNNGKAAPLAYNPESVNIKAETLDYEKSEVLYFADEVNLEGDNTLTLDLSALEAGIWSVVIPEGYVIIDDATLNSEVSIEYCIVSDEGGVELLQVDAEGVYRVYDLNGINVLNTTDAAALLNLRGLYIVNGKKVIFRN